MKRNVGNVDRGIRGLIGIVLILFAVVSPPADMYAAIAIWVVGVVVLATAVFSICLPYALFGISTCSRDSQSD